MSGSGGSRDDYLPPSMPNRPGVGGGGGYGGASNDPCSILQQAPLNSPNPTIVPTLKVGDVLRVVLNITASRPVLEVHTQFGVAGALTHMGHLAIVECMRDGRQYVAEVFSRSGAAVTLQVRPA